MKRVVLVVAIAIALSTLSASAQDIQPDNRFDGYPKTLIGWPSQLPDLEKCAAQEYYEPRDFHLAKYAERFGKSKGLYSETMGWKYVRVQASDECVWTRTRNGDQFVVRPKGTLVAQDGQGRDLFDLGTDPSGNKGCKNPRSKKWAIGAPPVVTEHPAAAPEPAEERRLKLNLEQDRRVPDHYFEGKGGKKWPWILVGAAGTGGMVWLLWFLCVI